MLGARQPHAWWVFLGALLRALLRASIRALLPFCHLLSGTRLASWLLPFDGTRDPELSVSKRDSTGESLVAQNTWERRFKQRCEREGREGETISTDSFLLITDFYYYFDWIKFLSFSFFILLFFFDIWTKNVFLPFWPMIEILFLRIILVLRYYHSMMLRGDQSFYEVIL